MASAWALVSASRWTRALRFPFSIWSSALSLSNSVKSCSGGCKRRILPEPFRSDSTGSELWLLWPGSGLASTTQPQELVPTTVPVTRTQAVRGRGPARLVHHLKSGFRSTAWLLTKRRGNLTGLAISCWTETNPQSVISQQATRNSSRLKLRLGAFQTPVVGDSFKQVFDRAEIHRLDHIGVGAQFVSMIDIGRIFRGRNNDDRYSTEGSIAALHPFQDLEATATRHADVHHDQFRQRKNIPVRVFAVAFKVTDRFLSIGNYLQRSGDIGHFEGTFDNENVIQIIFHQQDRESLSVHNFTVSLCQFTRKGQKRQPFTFPAATAKHSVMTDSALWKRLKDRNRFVLIAGPCVIESETLCLRVASALKETCKRLGVTYVFKASYDKANRTSAKSFRGPGLDAGLAVLAKVRAHIGVPVLTDVHNESQTAAAAKVADILQIPAFLCRQTDLIIAAARTGRIVNLKKGQFLSPSEMGQVVTKARNEGARKILVTERGTTFGYNNLVADMRAIPIMGGFGFPVIFDATHSVQLPGGGGDKSSGQREFAPILARSAVAAGANGIFIETHPDPERALSDGPNMIPLAQMPALLKSLLRIWTATRAT